MSAAPLVLRNGDCVAVLCPHIGATVARFSWRDRDVLRRAPDEALFAGTPRQMGCYPLVPFSNRVGHAQLIVGEHRYALRANAPPEPHALHGFGWQRPWQVVEHQPDAAELMLTHVPDEDWPFACEAVASVRLAADALHLAIHLRNTDHRPMPAGLGWHPYFPIDASTQLRAHWTGLWRMGADMLPTEHVDVPAEADFRTPRELANWKVDNCFTGWGRCAELTYATHRVRVDASDLCKQIVCFAPNDGRNFIALEPVSHVNNAFALAARGVENTGMRMLAPGESMAIAVSIGIEEIGQQK